jgi:hypothetical protein
VRRLGFIREGERPSCDCHVDIVPVASLRRQIGCPPSLGNLTSWVSTFAIVGPDYPGMESGHPLTHADCIRIGQLSPRHSTGRRRTSFCSS